VPGSLVNAAEAKGWQQSADDGASWSMLREEWQGLLARWEYLDRYFLAVNTSGACFRIVVCDVVDIPAAICGGAATDVAADDARRVRRPMDCGVPSLLPPAPSAAQDAQAAGSSLVDGVWFCDLSAPRGAEADAVAGMA